MAAKRGCYGEVLGGCGGRISVEHFMSNGILERLNRDRKLTVAGDPRHDGPKVLAPHALGAKILCQTHNSALSPLDAEAIRFFDAVTSVLALAERKGKQEDVLINGNLLERWALKVLVGLVISGTARGPGGAELPQEVSRDELEVLFGTRPTAEHCGLFFWTGGGNPFARQSVGVSTVPLIDASGLAKGVRIDVNGVHLRYYGGPVAETAALRRRPVRFKFKHAVSNARMDVRLAWSPRPSPPSTITLEVNTRKAGEAA